MPKSIKWTCPKCGGKKSFDAKTCMPCCERPKALLGKKGSSHPTWKGGFRVDKDGYIRTYAPDHPFPRKTAYVFEHVRVIELHIGRRLLPSECVHHKDHNRQNNDLTNLELMSRTEHCRLHGKESFVSRQRNALGRFA